MEDHMCKSDEFLKEVALNVKLEVHNEQAQRAWGFVGEDLEMPEIFDGDDSHAMPAPTLLSWTSILAALGIEDNTTPAAHADPSY